MSYIDIKETEKTPRVLMDANKKVFEMEGNSRPENVREFYLPITEKIDEYFEKIINEQTDLQSYNEEPFSFNFKLGYFNSSTAKYISDILMDISDFSQKGIEIKIYWFFDKNDEDMREAGEDFAEMVTIPFNYIMVDKN